jgi:hypothetical protein
MDLKLLSVPLRIDQIDFRVQSINKGGYATILAYKDARCDMQRLDDVCGPLNWKREHSRDNHNCTVSIWNADTCQWVGKEDTGTESNTEAQKGLASDSFKRACFNWGIGRELYDYPVIQVKLKDEEWDKSSNKATFKFRIKDWKWESEWDGNRLDSLTATYNGETRYNYVQDAPPPMPYTPEQLATFKMLVANEDGVGILKFSKSVDSDTLDALFNSAPKNQKTKLKERCRALAKEANDLRIKCLTAIHEAILEKQLDSVEEVLGDLEPDELEMVWGSLTEIEQMQIQNMRELAA